MAKRRRHHFVPRFYLQAFKSAPRRIHVLPLASRYPVEHASLRDQARKHRLYGEDSALEDEFARAEGEIAPALREIEKTGKSPAIGTEAHAAVLAFVVLQILRTPSARHRIADSFRKVDEELFKGRERDRESVLASPSFEPDDAELLKLQFQALRQCTEALADLRLHVASATRGRLVTSDNPVFRCNSYCRAVRFWGALGMTCRGLQIFLPISPERLLLLYDPEVYLVSDSDKGSSVLNAKAVNQLNAVQIVNAWNCIYFSAWSQGGSLIALAARHRRNHLAGSMRVNVGDLVGSEDSSILHMWELQPNLDLSLPLSRLRLRARRIPPRQRLQLYRRDPRSWF